MVYQDRGSCRCQTLPKILGYSLMTYSEPLSICFVLFNIRIPAAHSAFILSHHSLGLTLLPSRLIPFPRPYTTTFPPYSLHVGANSWPLRGSELTLSPPAVLTDWVPSLSTPSACRSLSMPFRFDTRTGLRPGCCTSSVISTNAFAYLPGLSLYVPRRSWKVQDSNLRCPRFQDVILQWVTLLCLRPLGQPSKYVYPES